MHTILPEDSSGITAPTSYSVLVTLSLGKYSIRNSEDEEPLAPFSILYVVSSLESVPGIPPALPAVFSAS